MASLDVDFRQRVASSARYLFSTISGVPETVSHLVPRKSTLETTQSPGAVIPVDFFRNATSSEATSQSLGSAAWSTTAEEDVYQEFVSDTATTSLGIGMGVDEWTATLGNEQWDDIWTRMAELHTLEWQQTSVTPVWERASTGQVVYNASGTPEWHWKHIWRRINTHLQRAKSAHEIRVFRPAVNVAETSGVKKHDADHDKSSPLARLLQVKQHLTKHEEAWKKWSQNWDLAQPGRCDWNRVDDVESRDNQEQPKVWYFSCHRTACHHTLLRANENLTLDIRQRACVHEDCGMVANSIESWLRHVTSPHHSLQGKSSQGEGEGNQSSYGLSKSDSEATP